MYRKELITQVIVHAPPRDVWAVLTDFNRYTDWNPFLFEVAGLAEQGGRLQIGLQMPGGRVLRLRREVCHVDPDRRFCCGGRLMFPGALDSEHICQLEPLSEGRTQFIQRAEFRGLLVPLLWPSLKRRMRRGFLLMNAALKGRVESLAELNLDGEL